MSSSGKGLDFARGILEKYGWKEGQGLGRKENGVTKALKPALKFDSAGIGYDGASEQFTSRWWEQSYNEVAKSISITQSKGDVKVKQKNKKDLFKSRGSRPVSMYTATDYNSFLKTSLLTGEGVMNSIESETQNVAAKEEDITCGASSGLTDEEIFRVCGGRTVHKGARHGLKLNGKLARIQRQEELLKRQLSETIFSASDNPSSMEVASSCRKPELLNVLKKDTSNNIKEAVEVCASSSKKQKKKKKKCDPNNSLDCDFELPEANDESNEISSTVRMIPDSTSSVSPLVSHTDHEHKKSKKKKKKRKSEKCEGENEKHNECDVTSSLFPETEKKWKRKQEVDTARCVSNTLGRVEMRASWLQSTDGECQQSTSSILSPQQSCPLVMNYQKGITMSSELSEELLIKAYKKRKRKNCHESHE